MADEIAVGVDVEVDRSQLTAPLQEMFELLQNINGAAQNMQESFRGSPRSMAPLLVQLKEVNAQLREAEKAKDTAGTQRAQQLLNNVNQSLNEIRAIRDEIRTNSFDRARIRDAQLATLTGDGRTVGGALSQDRGFKDAVVVRETSPENLAMRLAEALDRITRRGATYGTPGYADASANRARINAERVVARYGGVGSLEEAEAIKAAENAAKEKEKIAQRAFDFQRRMTAQRLREETDANQKEQALADNLSKIRVRSAELERKYHDTAVKAADDARDKARRADFNSLDNRVSRGNDYRDAIISSNGGADLFAFQSRLALNYQIFAQMTGAIRSSLTALVEFDDALGRFQAITATSNTEMGAFRKGLLDIASQSRFTVKELTDAAAIIGQTGASAAEVLKMLPAVTNLATASGSTLQQATEVITSTLGAFQMNAGRSNEVADIMVGALNRTKLSMDQLQLAIQYSANLARDSGVSFAELAAAVGSIAQAGVKSGSTIGTGTRALLQELLAPSEKLKQVLTDLGITLDQIDVKSNTFTGVLENLRSRGFSTAEAFRSMDIRAAAAFAALAGQSDKMKRLQEELLLSSSAAEAAATANQTLSSVLNQLTNTLFAITEKAMAPFVTAAKAAAGGAQALLSIFNALGPILPVIGAGITGIATAMAALKIGGLIAGLASAPAIIAAVANPVTLAVGATAAILATVAMLVDTSDKLVEKLDKLKAAQNELTGSQSETETTIKSIDNQITSLLDRREKLNSDPLLRRTAVLEAQRAFGQLGLDVKTATSSVDDLVKTLQNLRGEMEAKLPATLASQIQNLTDQINTLNEIAERSRKTTKQDDLIRHHKRRMLVNTFGAEFGDIYDVSKDVNRIDRSSPQASAAPFFRSINTRIDELTRERQGLQSKATNETATTTELARLETLNNQLRLLEQLSKSLTDVVARASNIQSLTLQRDRMRVEQEAAELRTRPDLQGLRNGLTSLQGGFDDRARMILGNQGLGAEGQKNAVVDLLRERRQYGSQRLLDLDTLRTRMLADGASPEAVAQATGEVADQINGFLKSVTQTLDEVSKSANAKATVKYQQERRASQAKIDELMKRISTATSLEEVNRLEEQVKTEQEKRRTIEKNILMTGKDAPSNPDDLDKHPALQAAVQASEEETNARLGQYMAAIVARKKAIEKSLLGDQIEDKNREVTALGRRRAELESALNDPNITPEKAKQLGSTLKELIDQIAALKGDIARLREQKDFVDRSAPGAVATSVDIASKDLPPVLQALLKGIASVEAGSYNVRNGGSTFDINAGHPGPGFGPNGKSSASGKYQFIYDTWMGVDGGPMTPERQDVAAIKLAMRRLGVGSVDELARLLQSEGLSDRVMGLLGPEWEGLKKDPTTARATYRRALNQSDEQGGIEAERRKGSEGVDRQQAEIERKAKLAALLREDRAGSAELAADQSALRRSVDANQASAANSRVMQDILDAYKRAQDREAQSRDGRSPAEKEEGREAVRSRFTEQAQAAAISGAEAVGKKVLDQYDRQIDLFQARIKSMELQRNRGEVISEEELGRLKESLRIAQERKAVEGELEANKRQIAELEKALETLSKSGLADAKDLLKIQEQIDALRKRGVPLAETANRSQTLARTAPSYETAASNAISNFGRQRGYVKADLSGLVDQTEIARKAIEDSLNALGSGFDKLFDGLATGTLKGKEAMKSFSTSFLADMAKIASKNVTNELFRLILGGGKGEDSAGILSSLAGFFGLGKAGGGEVPRNLGIAGRDSVPSMLMPGEFVLKSSAAQSIGRDALDRMNAMGAAAFNDNAPRPIVMSGGGARATSNVYIVDPGYKPPLGPSDIIATVGDNIQRNGALAQLVKSVTAR